MLPILDEAAGSMLSGPASSDTAGPDTAGSDVAGLDTAGSDIAGSDTAGFDTAGSMCSRPVSSSMVGMLTTEGAEDDIGGEGLGAVKTHQNMFPLHARCSSTIFTLWPTFLI